MEFFVILLIVCLVLLMALVYLLRVAKEHLDRLGPDDYRPFKLFSIYLCVGVVALVSLVATCVAVVYFDAEHNILTALAAIALCIGAVAMIEQYGRVVLSSVKPETDYVDRSTEAEETSP